MRDFLSDLPIEIEICENGIPDRFTNTVSKEIQSMSIEDLSELFRILDKTALKLRNQIAHVKYLSEIVTFKIVNIDAAGRIYDYFFRKLSRMDLFNYK